MKVEQVAPLNDDTWERCDSLWQFVRFFSAPGDVRSELRIERKCRLMVVAALRAVWPCLLYPQSQEAVEAAEQYADDRDPAVLAAAAPGAKLACELILDYSFELQGEPYAHAVAVAASQAIQLLPLAGLDTPDRSSWGDTVCKLQSDAIPGRTEAEAAALHLLQFRDIFGNPFRPITFLPEWRTDTAVALARQMYDARDFSAMPILADALQDAGCNSANVLDHCRGLGPHVRGCWVCDLVLGKE